MAEDNKNTESQSKWYKSKELTDYGIFLLILVVLLSVISLFIITNRNTWNKGLSEQVKIVLEKNGYKKVAVDRVPLTINSPMTTSCAAYTVNYEGCADNEKAIILKVSTLYGPVAAVYLYHGNKTVDFVDFTSSERISEKQNKDLSKNMQINYWKNRIPAILPEAVENKEGGSK